jgi:AAA domain
MAAETLNSLSGPKILEQGDSGSGKTFQIATAVEWGMKQDPMVEVFCLFVEPGLETLLGFWKDPPTKPDGQPLWPPRPIPPNLHWHQISNPGLPLSALIDAATKVGQLSYEGLTKVVDGSRASNNPYLKILNALGDFPDDRTGKKFGNISTWKADERILAIDSLTALGDACMKMTIGNKPTAAPGEYGVAQNNLMNLLRYLTQGFDPTVIMTAHLQRQVNELTGGIQLMTKGIGKAMADDIPPLFSEVLYCYREGQSWYWDTSAPNVTTKTRYLPIKPKIVPDLGVILDKWHKRGRT